jgi:hypothetical protein
VFTVQIPQRLTQAEIRTLYFRPDSGSQRPRLYRGFAFNGERKMISVDHSRIHEWVGVSAILLSYIVGQ